MKPYRALFFIWLGWFVALYAFQALVTHRLDLARPDLSTPWTGSETLKDSNQGKIYLLEPFLNAQVAWDSEYYLGIAVGGYDDPAAGRVTNPATGQQVIKNYSFFPLYPYVMRAVMFPLGLLGLNPIATASLAGVTVALLGTLAGMMALWDLTAARFGEEDAHRAVADRAVFYLLIFPTGFFLAQVYTEGLFIGLAFGSLALSRRGRWGWAAVLAVLAAWTRAQGAALALPLLVTWAAGFRWRDPWRPQVTLRFVLQGLAALLPLAAFLAWRLSPLGQGWAELQGFYYGRGLFTVKDTLGSLGWMWEHALNTPQAMIYLGLEGAAALLALGCSLALLRRDPAVALFSLAVVLLSLFSGSTQSLARYMLAAPAMFITLARLGRAAWFDRAWTLASLLLMGMSAMLFSFDFWVG